MANRGPFNVSYYGYGPAHNPPPKRGGAELLSFLNDPPDIHNKGSKDNSVDNIRNTRKERMVALNHSLSMSHSNDSDVDGTPTRANGRKRLGKSQPPLDDPTFAPPPMLPAGAGLKSSYELKAEREANYNALPKYENIRHSGQIMTRFSAVSLLTKKWRQNFWILYNSCLYFFRSKADFEEWLFNPYLGKTDRESLVKRYLDFNRQDAGLFSLDKIGLKYYTKGGMLHHFKLDKHYIRGPSATLHLVAAFASMNQNDVIELHTILSIMLKKGNATGAHHLSTYSETHSAYSSTYSMADGYGSTTSAGF